MGTPFLSEVRIVSFNFPPKGWALCDGQLLAINQNQALFSLLGTTYGGNGQTTFALPNLQGRVPVHMGTGFTLGDSAGEPGHTLNLSEMPAHTHVPVGSSANATLAAAANNLWASSGSNPYTPNTNGSMNPACVTAAGGGQAHENRSPFLVLNFIIALSGIFPPRS